jgi:hypothetical protein
LVDYWSISSYLLAPDWERRRFPPLNRTSSSAENAAKVDALDHIVLVDFPELVGKQTVLDRSLQRQHLLATENAKHRATALTHDGMEFLYGMILAQSFALQGIPSSLLLHNNGDDDDDLAVAHRQLQLVQNDTAVNTTKQSSIVSQTTKTSTFSTSTATTSTSPYAIALHSRHRQGEDGTNIRAETKCLRQLLDSAIAAANAETTVRTNASLQNITLQCRVCLMSDRPATVSALASWLHNEYPMCVVIDAARAVPASNVSAVPTSFRMEHGPYAGTAFVHELNVCQHYTDAFIGTAKGGSSSTALLEEWIAYQHYLKTKHTSPTLIPFDLAKPSAKCWL